MNLDDLMKKESEWLKGKGPKANIVISSRVRLARNISGMSFFNRAPQQDKKKALDMSQDAIAGSKTLKNGMFVTMKSVTDLDRQFLVERHLMSPEHTNDPENKALYVDEHEVVSIMVNEEDHLRMQVMQSGFNLMEAWNLIDRIDNDLSDRLPFAFSPRTGYLTACPTNTGTGLRGSVMLHLPALVMTNQMGNLFQAVSKLGLTFRGFYGEGTDAAGDFFQISNQVSLGYSEMDLLDNIQRVINKIITRESSTRALMMTKSRDELEDKIARAMGILKSAVIISSNEAISLLSLIRLGIDMGIVKNMTMKDINELFILIQPAHLQKADGKILSPQERDHKRAELVKSRLK